MRERIVVTLFIVHIVSMCEAVEVLAGWLAGWMSERKEGYSIVERF